MKHLLAYDNANRLNKDCFDYNAIARERVESHVEYVKSEDDSAPDNQVKIYSYKVNGTEKAKTENEYDNYKRVKNKKYTVGGMAFTKETRYDKTKVDRIVDWVGNTQELGTPTITSYEYDIMDRIVATDNGYPITYKYDIYGQLIREDNIALDKTFVYEYNSIGNIVSVKTYGYTSQGSEPTGDYTQKVYTYDAAYPDRVVNCGGTSVSYNAMGCPTTYNGYAASWTRGKLSKLSKGNMVSGTHNYEYSYNAFGQRVGRSYSYTLGTLDASAVQTGMLMGYSKVFRYDQSGRLIYESKTSKYYNELDSFESIVYLYDENSIVGMDYTANGQTNTYYFQRNLLGDVVGIYNTSGTKVGGYVYDAWGNCTITLNTNGIASLNPIRYRGYYYDTETGLYYLNARYYSPEWRRFISPDAAEYIDPETPNGLNLYAYCYNDPVNYADPSGHSVLLTLGIFALSSLVMWGVSELFGAQIAGGIGSVSGGATAISTGISLCAFGPWGTAAGIILMAVGGFTVAFGANEIIDGAFGTNYIQQWTGWSDDVYNDVYIGLNIASAVGSIAGNIGMRLRANTILNNIIHNPSKVNDYKLWQLKTFGKYTSLYTPGSLKKGLHAGQGYTLTNNKNASLGYIQWHPGGGHHGPSPYWKITSSFNKAARFDYLTGLPF